MEKEIKFLQSAVANPNRPFAAIVGGAKVKLIFDLSARLCLRSVSACD